MFTAVLAVLQTGDLPSSPLHKHGFVRKPRQVGLPTGELQSAPPVASKNAIHASHCSAGSPIDVPVQLVGAVVVGAGMTAPSVSGSAPAAALAAS
jgi:hypothetical protein